MPKEFDITKTYINGDRVAYNGRFYEFSPHPKAIQTSTGNDPVGGSYWYLVNL